MKARSNISPRIGAAKRRRGQRSSLILDWNGTRPGGRYSYHRENRKHNEQQLKLKDQREAQLEAQRKAALKSKSSWRDRVKTFVNTISTSLRRVK